MKQKQFVAQVIATFMAQDLKGDALKSASFEEVKRGLMSGECEYSSGPISDEKEALGYAKSVVNNELKKNKTFNGGVKYEPKVRRGPVVKDPTYKSLKLNLAVLKKSNDPNVLPLINQIETKMSEIEASEKTAKSGKTVAEAVAELAALGISYQG